MRGVPRSGLWSEGEIASSGTGSERAQVASVAEGNPLRARGPGNRHSQPGARPLRTVSYIVSTGDRNYETRRSG